MKKYSGFFAVTLALIFAAASPLSAQEATTGDYFHAIGTKFVRGIGHVLSSPADIPCTITHDVQERGGAGVFTGLGTGTLLMLRRILVGATEVGTFMIPAERTIPAVCQSASL